jgi:dihydrolipoamide dehydrogenase
MSSVWSRLGAKVTVLEALDRILTGIDAEIASKTHKLLEKQGLEIRLKSRVKSAKAKGKTVRVELEEGPPIDCDRLLLAVGRVANTDDLGLDTVGVATDRRGVIQVDENYATSAKGVYAIGDCVPGPMLAHKASEEGVACVEKIAGRQRPKSSFKKRESSTTKARSPSWRTAGPRRSEKRKVWSKSWPTRRPTACWESTFSGRGPAT